MKRIRNSTACEANPIRNGADKVIPVNDSAGPSFSDLPNNILVTILLKLPVKRILVCKCVCKPCYHLISDPKFAKLHFNQAQVYPLLRISGYAYLSRVVLYLLEHDFERNLGMCYDPNSPIKIELDSKLKLPLCNTQMILDQEGVGSEDCLNLIMENHKYDIVNSCNGLLCLSSPCHNEPVIVCNPVTGEFINLPKVINQMHDADDYDLTDFRSKCGFGFSPVTNQYKVIRMSTGWTGLPGQYITVAEVHTLGTENWRVLPSLPESTFVFFPTYLNGCVYWLSNADPCSVISFDIEKECFESISIPPPLTRNEFRLSMGVLGGELFISAFQIRDIRFWAMKDNGAKSWSQIYSFQVDNDDEKWPPGSYEPIKYLNNGELLIFHSFESALICKDPRKTGYRYLKIQGYFNYNVEVIPHFPSFVPLEHALSGHDVTVLNVKSRCSEVELHEEGQAISIIEVDMYREPDFDDDAVYEMYDIDSDVDPEFEY